MNYCGQCGTKLSDGGCATCTAKSTNSINVEQLEKALNDLETLGKGQRPAEAKFKGKDERSVKEVVEDAVKQAKKYGDHGEGDSEEEPKTKKDVESATKGGFMPPAPPTEDPEEEEREREEEEERERGGGGACAPMPFKSTKGKAKKSMQEDVTEDEEIRKAVDVSPFLESLTVKIAEHVDDLRDDVTKSINGWNYQQRYNIGLAKALGEMGELVKGLTETIKSFSNVPASGRKGDVTVVEKGFGDSSSPILMNQSKSVLNKSEIAGKLLSLKAAGDTSIDDMDILRVESSGVVRPELMEKLGVKN